MKTMTTITRRRLAAASIALALGAAAAAGPRLVQDGPDATPRLRPVAPAPGPETQHAVAPEDGDDDAARAERRRQLEPLPPLPSPGSGQDAEAWRKELERFHQDMERWRRDLEAFVGESLDAQGSVPGGFAFAAPEGDGSTSGEFRSVEQDENGVTTYEMKVDPGGRVEARVVSEKDGERREETYEADSLEAFQREHPELAQRFGVAGDGRLRPFAPHRRFFEQGRALPWFQIPQVPDVPQVPRLQQAPPFWTAPLPEAAEAAPPGPRLGVQVAGIAEDDPLRAHLQLAPGTGLLVLDVTPGSLAEELGMRRHDVLIGLNGRDIRRTSEVREALEASRPEDAYAAVVREGRVTVLRRDV